MNYKFQRKIFNLIAGIDLLMFLKATNSSYEKQKRIKTKNLRKLMKKAYEIPFYKERFDKAGVRPQDIKCPEDLVKLPILTKAEFRQWMIEEGMKEENNFCMRASTSGSTGCPMEVICTPAEYAADIANVTRSMMVGGYNPFLGKTLTEMDNSSENVGYKSLIQRMGILRREVVDGNDDEINIIKFINKYKPNLIRMYKSEFMRVAVYAEKHNIKIHSPKYLLAIGENIDEISARVLKKAYGAEIINVYGCVEAGSIAVKKPGNSFYTLLEDACLINIYDSQNRIVRNGHGRVMLTTLYKDTFPLINYDLRDYATVQEDEYGRVFTELYGRENADIKYLDGTSVGWIRLWHIAAKQRDILQMRIIQMSYHEIIIQLVKNNESELSYTDIEAKLTTELNVEFKNRIQIKYEWMESIPQDPNGKQRMIISKI